MKYITFLVLISCLNINCSSPNKEQRLHGYSNSMEYGCYYGITIAVSHPIFRSNEKLKNQIIELSLKECPKEAKEFKEFIESN